jgi:hypothetical protein
MSSHRRPLSLDTVVKTRSNQVSSRVEDELVILDLDRSLYYALDPVGARVFELLREPRAIADVVGVVVAEFDVDVETARADLLALVEDLVSERLVEAAGSDARP